MYKKIVLIMLCFLAAISCSNPSSPNSGGNGDIVNGGDSGQTGGGSGNDSGNGGDSGNTGDGGSTVIPPTKPTEEELIVKYGIDIGLEDSVISKKIEENLKAYHTEMGSYRVIFTGKPKAKYSQQTSLAVLVLASAQNISADNIVLDLKNIDFSESKTIDSYMFAGISSYNITLSIIFPEDKIETIGMFAFTFAYYLKEIEIPNSVISISALAFQQCSKLENLILGNNVQSIGMNAFTYSKLKELTIPASVKAIGNEAFSGSSSLTTITYLGASPDSITSVGESVFGSAPLTTLILPNVSNPDYNTWKNFLGGNFTEVKQH